MVLRCWSGWEPGAGSRGASEIPTAAIDELASALFADMPAPELVRADLHRAHGKVRPTWRPRSPRSPLWRPAVQQTAGAGHAPHMERPEEIDALLLAFAREPPL